MLRLFEHVNFTALLIDFDRLHIFFVDGLDGDLLSVLLVYGELDQAELALSKSVLDLVVVKHV